MAEPAPVVGRNMPPATGPHRARSGGAHLQKKNIRKYAEREKIRANAIERDATATPCRDHVQSKNDPFRKIEFVCKTRLWEASRSGGAQIEAGHQTGPREFLKPLKVSSDRIFQLGIKKRKNILTRCV